MSDAFPDSSLGVCSLRLQRMATPRPWYRFPGLRVAAFGYQAMDSTTALRCENDSRSRSDTRRMNDEAHLELPTDWANLGVKSISMVGFVRQMLLQRSSFITEAACKVGTCWG